MTDELHLDYEEDRHPIDVYERDACALICAVRKGGQPTHGNVKRTIEGLTKMGHRTGYIDGEGDGVGILTDIPRELWTKRLARAGLRSSLATDKNFWVAHLMIPAADRRRAENLVDEICRQITNAGLHVLFDERGKVHSQFLGPNAERNEPVFWQIAGLNGQVATEDLDKTIFNLQVRLERDLGVHFPSFSTHSVVYKVQGTVEILRRYYPELRDPDYASTVTLGHARYSTNTNPIFERAQPFGLMGHNGEFNTISRFKLEAAMLGIQLDPINSDSQDVDRVLQALCTDFGLDLIEAMEYVFPPHDHDLLQNAPDVNETYENIRRAFGPFAQGPAAVAARMNDLCVFSVDALGLRPLWFGETEKEYFVSSERGVYTLDSMIRNPKPMAPGEKVALRIKMGYDVELLNYSEIQQHVHGRYLDRVVDGGFTPGYNGNGYSNGNGNGQHNGNGFGNGKRKTDTQIAQQVYSEISQLPRTGKLTTSEPSTMTGAQPAASQTATEGEAVAVAVAEGQLDVTSPVLFPWQQTDAKVDTVSMAALGWERYHNEVISAITENRKEMIGALGWDGPLAALSYKRVNISDYFKETVAVVTNPAIDREREAAQFSTRVVLGARPMVGTMAGLNDLSLILKTPILLGGYDVLGSREFMSSVAEQADTQTLEDVVDFFGDKAVIFSMSAAMDENIDVALDRLAQSSVDAVRKGARCILLDDSEVYTGETLWLDPLLVVASVDRALRLAEDHGISLRRRVGIILRSGALRDLHDLALSISLGANAVNPYAIFAVGANIAPKAPKDEPEDEQIASDLINLVGVLTKGVEKVTSTIGCHELRGYGHSFSSIGLSKPVAKVFGTPNYFGSGARGLTWSMIKASSEERAANFRGEIKARLENPDRFYPKMWKKAEDVAHGLMTLEEYTETLFSLEEKHPVAIRHILGLKESDNPVAPENVDIRIGDHDMPVIISAMSFGSQGELAYKTYAEAAYLLNIICVNGEGGELSDILGKYPNNRGQQVASGRFGVNIALLNSSNLIEIKIGQGAKPGEGGHLPGFKVTEQVAAARSTVPGVGLISPSNNHDLYSIEDLAQLIDELKTANPNARVSVKIPVVPGVGIIAVGVAKAGADIINITGYDGGTGAARAHALRHVGGPAELGVWLAHSALIDSGLRTDVELWADGGMKSGRDVVKMLCMGADRVGFGTLAMVAVGCTICRKCMEGTCHVGITTHIKTNDEANAKGLKSFRPFTEKGSADGIVNMFNMLADDIRLWTGKLGFDKVTDLVGRADLLEQIDMLDRIDLSKLTQHVPPASKKPMRPGGRRLNRPRNTLSKQITQVVRDCIEEGDYEMTYDDEQVMAMDRALATHLNGALQRQDLRSGEKLEAVHLSFSNSAIPGNGLAAFLNDPIDVMVEGGAQDGVAKCAMGGRVTILKGLNHNGLRLDGSVGKSFAYGAQGGMFIVQGNADSRACIRLSGADVIFGGEVVKPLQDDLGNLGTRANLKGYACEYMTSGRVMILGDPGPWLAAGMTGGVIYQRIQPEMNLTIDAIRRRIAKGSVVEIYALDDEDIHNVHELLSHYIQTLEVNNQAEATEHLYPLLRRAQDHFIKITPPPHG